MVDALRAAGAERLPDLDLPARLEEIRSLLGRHNTCHDQQQAAHMRACAAERMNALTAGAGQPLAVDTRLDSSIAVPKHVVEEAGHAATVLLRLTTKPFGSAAWLDYHSAFRARYGPGALVPVRELVADSGLGYPGGYLGAQAARPAWRMLTDRDAALLAMIQRAALDGAGEIVLTDADVEALTVGDHESIVPPQRIEIGVTVHAVSAEAIDRGEFAPWVTATPKTYTSMAGRFAHLLDEADQERLAASYTVPSNEVDSAFAVQLSFPPRRRHNQNVVRVPRLLPDVVPVSEHPDGDVIDVDDLAVTADADQMYLVQRSTGRRVVPRILHALDTTFQSPPLARFLAEVADARTAVFGPFDFGVARTLPHTPRIRYRRTVLAPARWTLSTTDLPTRATGQDWDTALAAWRQRWRVPPQGRRLPRGAAPSTGPRPAPGARPAADPPGAHGAARAPRRRPTGRPTGRFRLDRAAGRALAAASMAQLAAEFAPDPPSGYRALLGCLPRQAGQVDRRLSDLARHLSNPTADFQAIRTLPGGEQVVAAWQARDEALRAYHHTLAAQRDPATVLRTLLHEHHVRALGVDPDFGHRGRDPARTRHRLAH